MEDHEHYFTGHTNARLTFVIGIMTGVAIVTVIGLVFFIYLFAGGELETYGIAPLDTESQILTEPIKTIADGSNDIQIAIPSDTQIYGAKENYAVTLVQYVDYECRFCKKFLPDILEFVDQHSGEVRLIVKQYPLVQIHPQAKPAAVAATCAAQQGKFFEYSMALFAKQNELASAETYTTVATETQLDTAAFAACQADPAIAGQIEADAAEALQLDVQTQPNLVIWHNNGDLELIDGYVNISYIESALADELTASSE